MTFSYTIRDALGIHARPAGQLAKLAKAYEGTAVTIAKGEKSAQADRLLALMGLGIRHGDTVTVTVEGAKEEEAAAAVREFFEKNL
ncbi:MAG: HPr family phosphocarrier protein [Clostridia bacterium]|nr:HPr family phosphocarrier protein [Clostridia bacterium]